MNQPEQAPQSNKSSINPVYFDALEGLDFSNIAHQIRKIEIAADKEAAGLPSKVEEEGPATEALDELAEYFLLSNPQKSVFTGVAYEIKDNDDLDVDEPHLMIDAEITLDGPEYTEIDDAFRIIFALKQTLAGAETHIKTSTRYAVFLESILRLEYIQESLLVTLARHADTARKLVADEEFLTTRYDEQIAALQATAVSCYNELLPSLDDDDVTMVCDSSVVRIDVKKGETPKFTTYNHPGAVIKGTLNGCVYPDVLNRGKRAFRTTDEFAYGYVPYITMRDNEAGKTTYIAIDAITAIE